METIFCHRCGKALTPGEGDFYLVRIEALADPTPPTMNIEDLDRDFQAEMADIIEEIEDRSEQELKDEVYRRLALHLCQPCYQRWIDNPAGNVD